MTVMTALSSFRKRGEMGPLKRACIDGPATFRVVGVADAVAKLGPFTSHVAIRAETRRAL